MKIRLSPSGWLAIAAVLILIAAGAFLFELKPVQSPPQWTEEATRNPYLAAGRLLEKRGFTVRYQPEIAAAPAKPGVLFLSLSSASLPDKAIAPLLAWVRQGNRLILPARLLGDEEGQVQDPLLPALGVVMHDQELEAAEHSLPDYSNDRRLLSGNADDGWLEAGFQGRLVLEDTTGKALRALEDGNGIHVLEYRLGDGRIVVVTETGLFTNQAITWKDNAALFLRLFGPASHEGEAQIVYGGHARGILELFWDWAWPLIISVFVLALALIWYGNSRFGPLLPSPDQPRRRLAEHLQAAGRYLWYAGRHQRLYNAVRQSLRRHIFRRHPQWRSLTDGDLIEELTLFTGLDSPALRQALADAPTHDLARFVQDMRVLHQLRKLT
ncbi:uncharacterized protein DUF4350 [Fluviicoccus keumensis]|uniref:Uncharacterized protein DUF4350 n=1 Tax=Fluviicoccus keumensis TaxID=1435465 RepID=A0A4Q7Z403_9GAMM|nr:DUF4350 domain-containing protein [Fluviicoccus keumensis]RZU45122.1 uncharacterized protein DUF4350 [Fluviicoccus keumensis]